MFRCAGIGAFVCLALTVASSASAQCAGGTAATFTNNGRVYIRCTGTNRSWTSARDSCNADFNGNGTTFYLVRIVGGRALTEIKQPLLKRALGPLEKHPIRTVALLRAVLWFAPAVNYALGLSAIRYRDYIVGSAIGFLVPMSIFSVLFDYAMAFFG